MGTKEIKVFFTTPQVGQLFEHPRCKEGAGPTGFGERSLRIAAVPFCCQRRFSNTEDTGWKEGQPVLIYENRPFYHTTIGLHCSHLTVLRLTSDYKD